MKPVGKVEDPLGNLVTYVAYPGSVLGCIRLTLVTVETRKRHHLAGRDESSQVNTILTEPDYSSWAQAHTNCDVLGIHGKGKGKGFPYSIPSVGPGADPVVQAVSLQVTVGHPPDGRLPLLSARPAVTSPAAEHHRRLAGTKLYCLVTEAYRCKQLA